MQPRPIAETSRLLFPSLRFCIAILLVRDCVAWRSTPVLFVADLLHPVDGLAVERLLNGDVGHCGGRGGAVPVLLARRNPDDVARPDLFDGTAPALRPSEAECDDQDLAERMRMPGGAGAGLERHGVAGPPRGRARREQGVDPHRAGAPRRRSLARRLRTASFDLHSSLRLFGQPTIPSAPAASCAQETI